jgi:hypothetical protein
VERIEILSDGEVQFPSFVHDLRLQLRPEVQHPIAHHREDVALPIFVAAIAQAIDKNLTLLESLFRPL